MLRTRCQNELNALKLLKNRIAKSVMNFIFARKLKQCHKSQRRIWNCHVLWKAGHLAVKT